MIEGSIKGKRINLEDGSTRDVQLSYEIEISHNEYSEGQFIFRLVGGPTGYESFIIDEDMSNLKKMAENGWNACIGTKGVYDKLEIEADEMKKVLEVYTQPKSGEEKMNEVTEDILRETGYTSFLDLMKEKEVRRRKERVDMHGEPRPKLPWMKYTREEIVEWLKDEIKELYEALEEAGDDDISDELVDVGNMCEFLWSYLNIRPSVKQALDMKKRENNGPS